MKKHPSTPGSVRIRHATSLPRVDLGWIRLRDHFVATVGPRSGRGEMLGNLLVLADARLEAGARFPMHPHQDMEVLTWVASGTLHHRDDQGSEQFVPSGSLQVMSARDGIYHAEGNSGSEELRLLQIWVRPQVMGGNPEVRFASLQNGGLELLAGPEPAPLRIRQNLWLFAGRVDESLEIEVPEGQVGYAVFIGDLMLDKSGLGDGDAALLPPGRYAVTGAGQVLLMLQEATDLEVANSR